MDNGLGALRGLLEDLGEWDNTVVIFFSDNGGLPSHGSVNRPFRGGKGDYWEGGVHVPAFVSGGLVSAALRSNGVEPYRYGHLTHVTDVHATVLGLGGVLNGSSEGEEEKGSGDLDGFDLWEALVQTKAPARQAVVINLNSPNFASSGAVRWGNYKLMRNPEPKETVVYSRVQTKLVGEGLMVSEVRTFEFDFACDGNRFPSPLVRLNASIDVVPYSISLRRRSTGWRVFRPKRRACSSSLGTGGKLRL